MLYEEENAPNTFVSQQICQTLTETKMFAYNKTPQGTFNFRMF